MSGDVHRSVFGCVIRTDVITVLLLVGWLTEWFALAAGTIMMIFCACSLMYSYYDPRDSVYTVCRTIECSVWLGKSVAEYVLIILTVTLFLLVIRYGECLQDYIFSDLSAPVQVHIIYTDPEQTIPQNRIPLFARSYSVQVRVLVLPCNNSGCSDLLKQNRPELDGCGEWLMGDPQWSDPSAGIHSRRVGHVLGSVAGNRSSGAAFGTWIPHWDGWSG